MGTWGFELYQNDTSLDVKDEFEELYNAGKTAADITDKLINDYKSITGNDEIWEGNLLTLQRMFL